MKKMFSGILLAALTFAFVVGSRTKADAAFFAAICNDLACSGGDDLLVQDGMAGDTLASGGAINFSASAFGYSLAINSSQSKPLIGSAAAPQLDLSFVATTATAGASSIFLYASDTDFTGAQSFALALGGTNSNNSGSVTGRAWGASDNTALSFSGANLLGTVGPLSGLFFGNAVNGSYTPSVDPYSLTIGVAITRTTAGTSTGDLNLQSTGEGSSQQTVVPEPASMLLLGSGLAGLFARRRRQASK